MDIGKLKDKVYLKILEDCDNPRIMSNELLMQACMLFDEFSFETDQARVVKEVYNEVVKRAHFMTQLQLSQIDHSFSRL